MHHGSKAGNALALGSGTEDDFDFDLLRWRLGCRTACRRVTGSESDGRGSEAEGVGRLFRAQHEMLGLTGGNEGQLVLDLPRPDALGILGTAAVVDAQQGKVRVWSDLCGDTWGEKITARLQRVIAHGRTPGEEEDGGA